MFNLTDEQLLAISEEIVEELHKKDFNKSNNPKENMLAFSNFIIETVYEKSKKYNKIESVT